MGFSNSPIHGVSLAAALAAALALLCAAPAYAAGEDAGASATLDAFILPEYHKADNRLQCILYGDRAINQGAFITLKNALLDIVHNNIRNINEVANLQSVKLYPIEQPAEGVKAFWKGKGHSRGLISSPSAVYDRTTKMLRGDETVMFRSPEMDIDGVGFDANEETRFIHIRSKVRIVLRTAAKKETVDAGNAASAQSESKTGKDSK